MKTQLSDFNLPIFKRISGVAALFAGAAILFLSCTKSNIEQIKAFYGNETLPVLEARNFETLYTDSGIVRFSLKAPKLLRFEEEGRNYIEFPEGLLLTRYDQKQQISSSISAKYARQYVAEQKWEAKNNVIATNINGDTLKTEVLIWEEKSERIYTDEFVKIITPDQIWTGIGFTSDQSMQNWKILKPKGVINVTLNNNSQTDSISKPADPQNNVPNPRDKGRLQFNNQPE